MRRAALLAARPGVVIVAAAVAVGGCASDPDDSPPIASIDVVAGDDFFDPDRLEAPEGRVEFVVANEGQNPHTFVIEGIGFKLRAFDSGALDSGVVRLEAGEIAFYCDIEGHRQAGMEGVLVVEAQDG